MHVILRLLPFLDNLEKAELFIKDPGLKMIKDQFMQTIKEMGVEEIDVMGKEFDPHTAEAIDIVEGEKDDIVVEVFEKGYKLGQKILRPAKVKVSKKS
jgi:molecular chaperone GrpE